MTRVLVIAVLVLALLSCHTNARTHYHNAQAAYMAKDYLKAVAEYDKSLAKQPDSVMTRLGKAKTLYAMGKWAEARALFEEFITLTEKEIHEYRHEREDAAYHRDRCRQELGETVEQDPSKIPDPPMGE